MESETLEQLEKAAAAAADRGGRRHNVNPVHAGIAAALASYLVLDVFIKLGGIGGGHDALAVGIVTASALAVGGSLWWSRRRWYERYHAALQARSQEQRRCEEERSRRRQRLG